MIYTIKNEHLEVSADTFGAELHSIRLDSKEYLWQCGNSWKRYAPVLFPFVCSPANREYKAKGKDYKMKANHGFARDSEFRFSEQGDDFISFVLCDNEQTLEQYPYHFELKVTYRIKGSSVIVENLVTNKDSGEMYYYIGGHPAFNCPLEEGESFSDYFVEYSQCEKITQKVDGNEIVVLDNSKIMPVERALFDNDVVLLAQPKSKEISLKSTKSSRSVTIKYPMSDCIAVWSPTGDDDAAFVCLEPWLSVPTYFDDEYDDIENKPHAACLKSGESRLYSYEIVLR